MTDSGLEHRLRTSREWFRAAFEQAPTGMAIVRAAPDGQRVVLRANVALASILARPVRELVGTDLATLTDLAAQPARCRRPDGSVVWAEVRTSPMPLPDVPGPTMLVHLVDVTEQHLLARRAARRAAMNEVVAQVATNVLADAPPAQVQDLVVAGVARALDAQRVTLAVPDPRHEGLRVIAAFGGPAGGPAVTGSFGTHRFGGARITAVRAEGSEPFTPEEAELLEELARQAGLAVELGRARLDQQRLAVLEDRQRIARDLHDTVIQDLIAVGMQLDARHDRTPDPALRDLDQTLVTQLEKAVGTLRAAVHHLQSFSGGHGLADTVRLLAAESAPVLGHVPDVLVHGPVDEVAPALALDPALAPALALTLAIDPALAPAQDPNCDPALAPALDPDDDPGVGLRRDTLAVVREALSNVARHAGATRTTIRLDAEAERLTVTVLDDGHGIPVDARAGHGIGNIRHRAAARGGSATITSLPGGGTEVVWSVPLPVP
ncbi:MAG TPA: ATP-binding protein [Kineosporiaceae bacterium]